MNRVVGNSARTASLILLFSSLLLSIGALGQAAAPPPAAAAQNAGSQQFANRVFAEFDKLVHAKRVKVGDSVTAHLTAPAKMRDGTELPKGSKLVGSITELKVKADSEGPSKLALLFNKVVTKDGKEVPVQLALVTVAPHTQQNSVDSLTAGNPMSSTNRGAARTTNATLNQRTTEGEALRRGLGARAPASETNGRENARRPGQCYT